MLPFALKVERGVNNPVDRQNFDSLRDREFSEVVGEGTQLLLALLHRLNRFRGWRNLRFEQLDLRRCTA